MREQEVVIIEDDHVLSEGMRHRVNGIPGFVCNHVFETPLPFLARELTPDIVLLDVMMQDMNGLDAIVPILAKHPETAIIMNTIRDDTATIFEALQKGALGYIDKQSINVSLEEVLKTVAGGGAYMTPKIARSVISAFQQPRLDLEKLTAREREITQCILEGLSYKLVADRLEITVDMVRAGIKSVYRKLNINSKGQLFSLANKKF